MNAEHKNAYTGGCLCAAVRYEITGELRDMAACHCTQCRKTSGHFVVATACKNKNLTITDAGTLTWFPSSPEADRGFCNQCGSSLFWRPKNRDTTSIMAGSLDAAAGFKICKHIYLGDAGDYYDVGGGVPGFEGAG